MKSIFFGLALVASTFAFSQKTSSVRFGLKAGLNVSTISNSDSKSKAGLYGGTFANIPVSQSFSVQPEVLYSRIGGKDSEVKVNMDYIVVPILLQYNPLTNLYLEVGPQFGFMVSAKGKSRGLSADLKDNFRTFDLGLGLGAGYYFTSNIGVNVRYVAGLTDVIKDREGGDISRNGVFQIGFAYKF